MNTTTQTDQNAKNDEGLPGAIADLGSAWARYGLRLGSAALEANAKNVEAYGRFLGEALATTAKTLGQLADSLAQKKAPAAETMPERDGVIATPADDKPAH